MARYWAAGSSGAGGWRKAVRIDGRGAAVPLEAVRRVPLEGVRLDAVPLGGGPLRRRTPDAPRQVSDAR